MKVAQASVKLMQITPNAEEHIELCGRICYASEDRISKGSAAKFIKARLAEHHETVIEHAAASIKFVGDRGFSHCLVRHRLTSVSQMSTQFCCYAREKFRGEISVIEPRGLSMTQRVSWATVMRTCEEHYLEMIGDKAKPVVARSVLPICLMTKLVMTANMRQWRLMLRLRTSKFAQPLMHELMTKAGVILKKQCPSVFHDFEFVQRYEKPKA